MGAEGGNAEIKPVIGRWVVLALLSTIGMLVGFTSVLLGSIRDILTVHFDSHIAVDWTFISNTGATIVVSLPLGLLTRIYPQEVKRWLLTDLMLLVFACAFTAISLVDKRLYFLLYLAQILVGMIFPIFVILVEILSISWFTEFEQATVFGVGYGAMSVGSLLAALIPAVMLSALLNSKVSYVSYVIMMMYAAISVFLIFLIIFTCVLIPNLPKFPPSNIEHRRRIDLFSSGSDCGWRDARRHYWVELKYLLKNWQSQALIWSYSISMTLVLLYFAMLPILPKYSGISTPIISSASKAYYLSCFAGGGAVSSITVGLLLDKIKSYRPLACVLGIGSVTFAVVQTVVYVAHSEVFLCIFVGLQGTTNASVISFSSEILKQNLYPNVSERTQAIAISILSSATFVISVLIFRSSMSGFGDISFYFLVTICCLVQAFLLLCINPALNRFHAENESLLSFSEED